MNCDGVSDLQGVEFCLSPLTLAVTVNTVLRCRVPVVLSLTSCDKDDSSSLLALFSDVLSSRLTFTGCASQSGSSTRSPY